MPHANSSSPSCYVKLDPNVDEDDRSLEEQPFVRSPPLRHSAILPHGSSAWWLLTVLLGMIGCWTVGQWTVMWSKHLYGAESLPFTHAVTSSSTPYDFHWDYLHPNRTCLLYSRHPAHPPCRVPSALVRSPATVESMSIAFTVCGTGEIQLLSIVHLKSWLLHQPATMSLSVYILTDDVAAQRSFFDPILHRWPRQPNITWLDATSLSSQYQAFLDDFGRCATARVFIPILLPPSVDLIAYVDVDSVLVNDPRPLWAEFSHYSPSTLMSFTFEVNIDHVDNHYDRAVNITKHVEPFGINTGVMLMNLTRTREWRWQGMSYLAYMMDIAARFKPTFILGDQDWFNTFLYEHQRATGEELWLPLPDSYNWRASSQIQHLHQPPLELLRRDTHSPPLVFIHGNGGSFFEDGVGGRKRFAQDAFSLNTFRLYDNWWGWPSS